VGQPEETEHLDCILCLEGSIVTKILNNFGEDSIRNIQYNVNFRYQLSVCRVMSDHGTVRYRY